MYNITYLRIYAVERTQLLLENKKRTFILRGLSKSLGYKNFGHLKRSYVFDENENFIKIKDETNGNIVDIQYNGYIFNPFALSIYFNISLQNAYQLKSKLDNYQSLLDEIRYDGVLFCSDLELIKSALLNFEKLESKRIMAESPFKFYCRRVVDYSIVLNGESIKISAFDFDGFNVNMHSKKHFKNYLNFYVKEFINEFLKYDNIIFSNSIIEFHKNYGHSEFEFVLKSFNCKRAKTPNATFGENIILISKKN